MLLDLLGLANPIILAPMSGGIGTPELCAAVSNERGLGSLPTGYLTPAEVEINITEVKKLTSKPFILNLFMADMLKEYKKSLVEMTTHIFHISE